MNQIPEKSSEFVKFVYESCEYSFKLWIVAE